MVGIDQTGFLNAVAGPPRVRLEASVQSEYAGMAAKAQPRANIIHCGQNGLGRSSTSGCVLGFPSGPAPGEVAPVPRRQLLVKRAPSFSHDFVGFPGGANDSFVPRHWRRMQQKEAICWGRSPPDCHDCSRDHRPPSTNSTAVLRATGKPPRCSSHHPAGRAADRRDAARGYVTPGGWLSSGYAGDAHRSRIALGRRHQTAGMLPGTPVSCSQVAPPARAVAIRHDRRG